MPLENTEQVPVADLAEGDVVLHPERQMWMRVVKVRDVPETTYTYSQADGSSESRSFLRRITLDPIHRLKIETFIPFDLQYRDAEQFDTITRWKGGELPDQRF